MYWTLSQEQTANVPRQCTGWTLVGGLSLLPNVFNFNVLFPGSTPVLVSQRQENASFLNVHLMEALAGSLVLEFYNLITQSTRPRKA